MSNLKRAAAALAIATIGLLGAPVASAFADGPQQLPDRACNGGTASAAQNAPHQRSAEAKPHVEHAYPVAVPYCHHFNPTAEPPTP